MKNLKECLKEHVKDTIFIGSATGWFYIGKGIAFTEKMARELDAEYKKRANKRIRTCNLELQDINDKLAAGNLTSKEIKQYEARQTKLQLKIEDLNNYLADYTPLLEREVEDEYVKKYEPGTAIRVKGSEQAPYWTKTEYFQAQVG